MDVVRASEVTAVMATVRMSLSYPTTSDKSFAGFLPWRLNMRLRIGVGRTYELLLRQCCVIVGNGVSRGYCADRVASPYFRGNKVVERWWRDVALEAKAEPAR